MAEERKLENAEKSPEKILLECAFDGNLDVVKEVVQKNPKLNIDCLDDSGMTPLQQAAFRGNLEICKYLLERGADVNADKHENKYTALMFGALSGSEEVVRLLLDAGADPTVQNTVNRNAAEMAAFVSQHQCVGIINNFLASSELHRFTKPTGQETKAKIKQSAVAPLHNIITSSNLNPIYIILRLRETPELIEESRGIRQALDMLVLEKMGAHDTHESLALRLHYLSVVIEHTATAHASSTGVDGLLKRLAKGRASDGFLADMENLIRSSLRSFPRAESKLFLMLIQRLNQVKIGDSPTAVIALSDAVNGQRMRSDDDHECELCGHGKTKQCTGCHLVWYCSQVCQKLHRPTHKKMCKPNH